MDVIYSLSSLNALFLVSLGTVAAFIGIQNYLQNTKSKSGLQMCLACICVFFWDAGYAWMSQCYYESFAIYPRAVALIGIFLYLFIIMQYVAGLSDFPKTPLIIFNVIYGMISLFSFLGISQPSAIDFEMNLIGYWYKSHMSVGRVLQLVAMLLASGVYYFVLMYWKKKTPLKRERRIIHQFKWFGVILFAGYVVDTLIPLIFHTFMFPASSISAFFSVMLLYSISKKFRTFGASTSSVSQYVFRDVKVPVLVFDYYNKIVLFNDMAPKYFRRTAEELYRSNEDDLIMPYVPEYDDLADLPRYEGMFTVKKTGAIFKSNKTIVNDEYGELLFKIVFIQDMTNEQNALVTMAKGRAAAEAANLTKTNFLANMSHEIRTPMNAIIGMSDIILQSEEPDEETRAHVYDIKNAGMSLLDIINDILDISKIEAGKYEILEDEYDLPSLIHDATNIVSVKLLETQVKLITEVDPTVPVGFTGDMVRVRQILMNLMGNAIKFTNVGSIKFNVGWNKNSENTELIFTIKDTGIGIKKEDLDNIFGAFNQVDTRRNRNIQGTGLGLAISLHLAELMGGTIKVESLYGVGSTFTVNIKQKIADPTPIGEDIASALENYRYFARAIDTDSEVIERPDAKILVVDDNRVNVAVAVGLLKPYKMHVDSALSGAEAIEMVKKKDYDIIFMDHMMPDMDGIDTTHAIRALGGKYEDQVIIALTANAIDAARELFAREGLQDFLAKPVEKKQLNAILDKWLPVE